MAFPQFGIREVVIPWSQLLFIIFFRVPLAFIWEYSGLRFLADSLPAGGLRNGIEVAMQDKLDRLEERKATERRLRYLRRVRRPGRTPRHGTGWMMPSPEQQHAEV